MKSKVILLVSVFLMASLVSTGTVSCSRDSTEGPNGSDDVTQPLSEDEYQIEISAIAVELIATVNGLNQLLASPEMDDTDWVTTTNLAMEDITTLCDEACQIVPPDSMMDIHTINLQAIDGLDDAMGMLAEGIDEKDIDLVNQAATEMWLATEILAEFVEASE
jgi:hypothetical protein